MEAVGANGGKVLRAGYMNGASADPNPDMFILEQAEDSRPIVAGKLSPFGAGYFRVPRFDVFDNGQEDLAVFLCHHGNQATGTKVSIKRKNHETLSVDMSCSTLSNGVLMWIRQKGGKTGSKGR